MREAAQLARAHKVRLHTHLAENDHEIAYTKEKFNCTPAQYAEDLGWVGHDVWHAHCVKLDDEGTYLFARTRTGIAHCPVSYTHLTLPTEEDSVDLGGRRIIKKIFFFKQKTAYEIMPSLVGSEMCIRDRLWPVASPAWCAHPVSYTHLTLPTKRIV